MDNDDFCNKEIDVQKIDAFCIYFNGARVSIEWDSRPPHLNAILRICSISPQCFLFLGQNNWLYEGNFDQGRLKIYLSFKRNDVVDVQYCRDIKKLYIVTKNGAVLTQTLAYHNKIASNDLWRPVVFDPLELSEEGVRIRRVCCSSDGAIFVSTAGDIYALGNCGVHFSVDCDQPKLVRLFKSPMEILDLTAGDQFFVFLAKRDAEEVPCIRGEYGELPDLVSSDIHPKNDNASSSSFQSFISNCNLETNKIKLLQQGYSILHTEVFTMGSVNKGLLGSGDHIKRESLLTVQKLKEVGVCSLASGRVHTVARTIDGRLYHWGLNTQQQLTQNSQVSELSSPAELESLNLNEPKMNILEACCGDYRTVFINTQGEIHCNDKQLLHQEKDFVTLQMKNATKRSFPLLVASSMLTIYNYRLFKRQFHTMHCQLQTQLQTMMGFRQRFKQLRKLVEKAALKELQHVFHQWGNVLYLVIAIQNSLEQFYRGDNDETSQLVVIKYFRECINIFESYSKSYCDNYSIDGFNEAQHMFQHSSNLPSSSSSSMSSLLSDSKTPDILKMFQHPFQIVSHVIQLLEHIQKYDSNFKEELLAWLELARHNRIDLELADNTRDFWRSNHKNTKIFHFKRKERRAILTSTAVPLKLSHSMGLSTPTFVLFSDFLCQVVSHITPYPLDAMWLKKEDSGIRIITPEKNFLLISRNHHDKDLWYDQLESSIRSILNLSETSKIPEVRSIGYQFNSNHSTYPGVYVKGSFSNGVMHGKCRLEFPNGKIYSGDVIHGVVEGYGRMFQPKVGLYKGHFKNGKFCGHGTLIISEKEKYVGNFRNGLFHGHGHLQHSDCVYVGEFEDNLKCGYGVHDRLASGEKYLGLFADNKRIGSGICITDCGNYFEGSFANDELTGKSVVIFPNRIYFEGEAMLSGPNGVGKYFMPSGESLEEQKNPSPTTIWENISVSGSILSGHLSGCWQNIRIGAGTMEINAKFPVYPGSLGSHVVSNSRKWCSLFDDFENELFGDLSKAVQNTKAITFALWNRIVAFINKQQEIENENMIPRELDITSSASPSRLPSYRRHMWPLDNASTDFDKLSLNSSPFNFEKLELTKLHSQSEDTLNGLDFSSFDLLSTFNKLTQQNPDDSHGCPTFAALLGVMENSSATTMDHFNDSALSNNTLTDECLSFEMDLIPQFGFSELNEHDLVAIKEYLKNAFRYSYHPFKHLNERITDAFYRSYGSWKLKPAALLAKQAMLEWESISQRVYKFIRKLFPALPEEYTIVGEQREVVSHITLLYPILLSEGIYSTLFVLYANQYSHKDELYRQHLLQAEKLNDAELVSLLDFDSDLLAVVETDKFSEAVLMLKELKEKYSPMAMLTVIENCMEQLTHAYQQIFKENKSSLGADIIMPLTLVLLLRAGIHHLGAELALLDDLTDSKNFQFEMNGLRGYCYTTLKASYEHIASTSLFEKN